MQAPLRRPGWREMTAVLAALAAGAVLVTYPLAFRASHQLPDLKDPVLVSWTLAWDAALVPRLLRGVWEAPFLYPYHSTLAFGEHFFGIALFSAPLQWLLNNPIAVFNIIALASFVFAGGAMYLFARSLTGNIPASALAAASFAFYPDHILQIAHLQNVITGWMPLTLLGLHRYIATGSRRALAGAAVSYWLLAMSNGYYLFFFGLAAGLVGLWGLWHAGFSRVRMLIDFAVVAVLVGLAYWPVARVYFQVRDRYELVRDAEINTRLSADVGSYLALPDETIPKRLGLELPAYPKPAGPLERHDGTLFPGYVMIAFAALGLWRGQRENGLQAPRGVPALYGALATIAFLLSLGPEPTFWGRPLMQRGPYVALMHYVPGFDGLRVPARFSIVVFLSLSVLTAFGAARVFESRAFAALSRLRVAAVCAILLALVVVEGTGAPLPLVEFGRRGRPPGYGVYDWLAAQPDGAVVELPIGRFDRDYRGFLYEYATLVHGHRLVNGWTGYTTDLQSFLGSDRSPLRARERLGEAIGLFRGLGVRYLVVHPDDYVQREYGDTIVDDLKAQSAQYADVRQFGPVTAFVLRLPDADAIAPALNRVDVRSFTARVSDSPDLAPMLFDGDVRSRWFTPRPQEGREWIEVTFAGAIDLRRIRFEMHPRSFDHYPQALTVTGVQEDGRSIRLFDGGILPAFGAGLKDDPVRPAVDLALPPNRTTLLRLSQTGRVDGDWFWAVDELSFWTPPSGGGR